MQNAMNEAATRAITQLLFQPVMNASVSQFLLLNVSRDNIVQDTLSQLLHVSSSDLKKPLKVNYILLLVNKLFYYRNGEIYVQIIRSFFYVED